MKEKKLHNKSKNALTTLCIHNCIVVFVGLFYFSNTLFLTSVIDNFYLQNAL